MIHTELIAIGDEVISGQISDTNSAWLARELRDAGLRVDRITMVGDRIDAILAVLREAAQRSEVVVATGGLGPTFDDITRDAAAAFAGVGLERRPEGVAHLEAWFKDRGRSLPLGNLRQADLPMGSEMLENSEGTAPGFALRVSRGGAGLPRAASLFFLPGVPHEMEAMFRDAVMPRIRVLFPVQASLAPFKIHLFGLWESEADRRLREVFSPQELAHLGIRVSGGAITVAVYGAPGLEAEAVARATDGFPDRLRALFRDVAFGEGTASLAGALVEALRVRGATVALAESCTGGLIASEVTSIPGASGVFHRGWVVYSDDAKEELLGVAPGTLAAHGAVSEPTAREMALGALARSRAAVAVAVTGIAGPSGGTAEKPVGLVWFAAARPAAGPVPEMVSFCRKFKPPRSRVQRLAAATALDLARRFLEGSIC